MTKKVVVPWELKYKFVRGMLTTLFKGFMYEIREECGAATTLKIYENLNKRDDRIKNVTKNIKDVFKIEGNDAETIAKWIDIWDELVGVEGNLLEQSKTIVRFKVTKCPFKTESQDISNWSPDFLVSIVAKTINPRTKVERPKGMCAGDPYCEYIYKIEDDSI